jgi:hypothetical protein
MLNFPQFKGVLQNNYNRFRQILIIMDVLAIKDEAHWR